MTLNLVYLIIGITTFVLKNPTFIDTDLVERVNKI